MYLTESSNRKEQAPKPVFRVPFSGRKRKADDAAAPHPPVIFF